MFGGLPPVLTNEHERSLPGARGAKPAPMSPDNNKMFTEELQRTHAERERVRVNLVLYSPPSFFLEFNNRARNDNPKLKLLKMVVCCSRAAWLQHTTIFNNFNLGLSLRARLLNSKKTNAVEYNTRLTPTLHSPPLRSRPLKSSYGSGSAVSSPSAPDEMEFGAF